MGKLQVTEIHKVFQSIIVSKLHKIPIIRFPQFKTTFIQMPEKLPERSEFSLHGSEYLPIWPLPTEDYWESIIGERGITHYLCSVAAGSDDWPQLSLRAELVTTMTADIQSRLSLEDESTTKKSCKYMD